VPAQKQAECSHFGKRVVQCEILVFAQPQQSGDASPDELRKLCIARIRTHLKRMEAGKNAGRALFELSDYLACFMVIMSRN
jgi:hypothetical protein